MSICIKAILARVILISCFVLQVTCLFIPTAGYGQTLLSKKDTSDVRFVNGRKFYFYKVEKSETLFSISQKFKIPQEEIRELNPEIDKTGLKAKMKLWLPAYSWAKKDDPGSVLLAPEEEHPGNSMYAVTVITTLNLSRIYLGDGSQDSTFINEAIDKDITENLHFIEGCLKAIEDLKVKGFKVHLSIFDSESDTGKINSLISKSLLKSQDLVITNENGVVLKKLSMYSKTQSIRLLSCGNNTADLIKTNPEAISLFPSSFSQCKLAGSMMETMIRKSDCILIKTGVAKENERAEFFGDGWMEQENKGRLIRIRYAKDNPGAFLDSVQKGRSHVIFIPSSDEELVSTLLNVLKEKGPDFQFSVVGLPTWQYFETIDPDLFRICNVHLFNAGFVDEKNIRIEQFRKYFRSTFNTEPLETAFVGYDAMNLSGERFLKYGKKFYDEKKDMTNNGVFSDYRFSKIISGECLENKIIHMIRFEDYLPVCIQENK